MFRPALLLVCLASACHKESPPPSVTTTPAPAVQDAPQGIAASGGIVLQLQNEAANRPKGTPTTDQVFAAIEAAGVKLEPHKQVLGVALRARYCELGGTVAGLGMSVCEFDDAAAAKAARERSEKTFKAFGERTFVLNGATLLSMNPITKSPEVEAQKAQISDVFAKLTAR